MKRMIFAVSVLVVFFATPTVWAGENATPCVTSEAATVEEMDCVDAKMAEIDAIMDELTLGMDEANNSIIQFQKEGGFQSAESKKKAEVLAQRLEALSRDMEN